MKKLLLAVLLLPLALTANADPITREEARQRAEQFLLGLPLTTQTAAHRASAVRLSPVQNRAKLAPRRGFSIAHPDHELYYVFNRGEGAGYVIATGDDSTYPVLGYTDEGEFDYNQLPPNMKWWLEWMTAELQDLAENPTSEANRAPRRVSTHPAISPMVTTKWNQGSPYNDLCPKYTNGERCVTGCVATAMAQVMYFQRSKSVTETQKAMPGYSTNGINVPGVAAGEPISWDNMIDSYGSNATASQKKAVAQLMLYCGVGVEMMYNISANGGSAAYSYNVVDALKNYFGYGNSVKYISTSEPGGDSWDNQLYKELQAGRPFYLAGSNNDGGHAFVCDGYDGNQCFHINWGWGGGSDGYYMLSKLNPGSQGIGGSTGGYSGGPEAVIGIEPENYSTRALPISNRVLKSLCETNFDTDADGIFTYGEAAAVTDLGDVFKGQNITTFAELYYFTGLTSLSEGAFEGCAKLATIKLPKNLKKIGARAFSGCAALKTFVLPDGLTAIGDEAFDGCKVFNGTLPTSIETIGEHAFRGCAALSNIELSLCAESIGAGAFADCTKLKEVTLRSVRPQQLKLGADIFADVDLSNATLNVMQGTKAIVSSIEPWSSFGTIYEMRDLSRGQFVAPEMGKQYFIYNVGTGRYLTAGEAYGTQAIVDATDSPMRFELRQSNRMTEGIYYLYSDDTASDNHILFRTSTDDNVGSGVRACFVDGPLSHVTSKTAWWALAPVEGEENVFTFQIPSGVSGHKDEQYLGVNPDHASNAASPTYGIYSDIPIADFTKNCHWMFVEYDAQAAAINLAARQLRNLLDIAAKNRVDATLEQAVYDDLNSTEEEISKAKRRLRRKLGYIVFENDLVRQAAIKLGCDLDGNEEITLSEAAYVESFENVFTDNTEIRHLPDLQYFTNLSYIAGNSFKGCSALEDVILPDNVTDIYYHAFMECAALKAISLPQRLEFIGDDAFNGCTSLSEVTVPAANPADIDLGDNVFGGVKLAEATLCVPKGSADAYREAPVWKEFGTIREVHSLGQAPFCEPTENEDLYVYNLGLRRYITSGEAYGTQGVVGLNGIIYQLRRTKNMPEDTYYLYGVSLNSEKKVLFRTSTDSKVGEGVKTCFVDGTIEAKAYWKVTPVEGEENVYTLQVPENQKDYTEGEFLGVDINHQSKYTGWNYTYGLYWDIPYDGNERNCQWAFISKADIDALKTNYSITQSLARLLNLARQQELDVTAEQAVYDNLNSTPEEMKQAYTSVRQKLHFIDFGDATAQTVCTNAWDSNEDNELSYEEAAAVQEIGTTFRGAGITSLEELRYFTGLTTLPDDAFRTCSKLTSIYIPAGITSLGKSAFTGCSALHYAAFLTPQKLDLAESGATARNITLFVPADLVATYQESEDWGRATVLEYTGVPTVTPDSIVREYGRANPKTTFQVTGAPINGAPVFLFDFDTSVTAPVGEYPIVTNPGTITSPGLQCKNGVFLIKPAPATITATSFTRNFGEDNPEFTYTVGSLRNREKAEDILLAEPVIECDATPESPAGEYEIRVSGAEAQNYVFDYVPGTLTIINTVGVRDLAGEQQSTTLYDLNGRPVVNRQAQKGVYINGNKKITVK